MSSVSIGRLIDDMITQLSIHLPHIERTTHTLRADEWMNGWMNEWIAHASSDALISCTQLFVATGRLLHNRIYAYGTWESTELHSFQLSSQWINKTNNDKKNDAFCSPEHTSGRPTSFCVRWPRSTINMEHAFEFQWGAQLLVHTNFK